MIKNFLQGGRNRKLRLYKCTYTCNRYTLTFKVSHCGSEVLCYIYSCNRWQSVLPAKQGQCAEGGKGASEQADDGWGADVGSFLPAYWGVKGRLLVKRWWNLTFKYCLKKIDKYTQKKVWKKIYPGINIHIFRYVRCFLVCLSLFSGFSEMNMSLCDKNFF